MGPREARIQRPSEPSDAALVVAAREGASWASEALFRRYAPMVLGLSLRLLGRDDEAEDLAQEAFLQAFKALARLQEADAIAGWLRAIVVRTAHKMIRRRILLRRLGLGRQAAPLDVEQLVSSNAPPDVHAELRAVYTILEELPAPLRIALVLRRVEGCTNEEIAEQTDASLSTVKRRVIEADARLEVALAQSRRAR